ncbi:hypothetical protein FAI40_01105 [Acetobacteraceae bacterium]|nr:hypothetical protein FAI40_01105 [Acetobacteraceae bacterium]
MKKEDFTSHPRFPFKTVFFTISCVGVFLLGCTLHPFQRLALGATSPEARFYSYFILHGATQSVLGRKQISAEQEHLLLETDRDAKQSLVNKVFEGKMENVLTDYLLAIHP